jgi:DNA-binding transcriptional LysR family regulator
MRDRVPPSDPGGLQAFDGIVMRSLQTGRIRHWTMRDGVGREEGAPLQESVIVNDPSAMRPAALLDLGVTLVAMPDVCTDLDRRDLVRLLPRWYADAGTISLYYSSRTHLPAMTRAFVDWMAEAFKAGCLAERFAGSIG